MGTTADSAHPRSISRPEIYLRCALTDSWSEPVNMNETQFLSRKWSNTSEPFRIRWFHITENNTEFIKKCIDTISESTGNSSVLSELNGSWPSDERPSVGSLTRGPIQPHSRFMEPACRSFSSNDKPGAMSIFLPYLNWEEKEQYERDKKFIELHSSESNEHGESGHCHYSRTLDQFYYSDLADTTHRDETQTVSKWTGEESKDDKMGPNGWPGARPSSLMVMVDQLWLFVLDEKHIVTFFPSHTHGQTLANLYEKTNETPDECQDAYDFAAVVTSQAITLIFEKEYRRQADLFGIYQRAVGNKAARQTKCFENFTRSHMMSDANVEELELIPDIADIMDELNMLSNVLAKQEDVWKSLHGTLSRWRPKPNSQAQINLDIQKDGNGPTFIRVPSDTPGSVKLLQRGDGPLDVFVDKHNVLITGPSEPAGTAGKSLQKSGMELRRADESIKRLTLDAKNTHELVRELHSNLGFLQQANFNQLLNLLNLKQAAASLEESRDATKQGRAVMLFTIVTIIFLPLSFFTSYFGQNISEYTGDDRNPTSTDLWKIGGPVSAVVILLALGIAYYISNPESKIWSQLLISGRCNGQAEEDVESQRSVPR